MKRLLLPLVLLLPAACAEVPSDAAQVLGEAMANNQAAAEAVAPPAPSTVPAGTPSGTPAGTPLAVSQAGARGEPRQPGSGEVALASQLLGAPPEIVVQLLGQPRLRRVEGSAEIWHYQAPQCHLDLILYPEGGARPGLRVGHAAARADGTARRGEAACLRDIARGAGPVAPISGPGGGIGA